MNNKENNLRPEEKALMLLAHSSKWCRRLGLSLMLLGGLALGMIGLRAGNTVILLGWLIMVSGLAEAVHALHLRRSGAFFFHLVPSIAYISIGLFIVTLPIDVNWKLPFACLFTVVGLFRLVAAIRLLFPSWQWAVADGGVTLLLSAPFWTTKPWPGPQVACGAVGITLILRGWSLIMFGHALRGRRMPIPAHSQRSETREQARPQNHRFVRGHGN